MKTCSKCKVEQDENQFVKSPRYRDGLYPSCKTCRKKVHVNLLAKNPICIKCKTNPHVENHQYCYSCMRAASGQPPVPRWRRDKHNKLCSYCKQKERLPYGTYCKECKCIMDNLRWYKKGGFGVGQTPEQRFKNKARQKLQYFVKIGKIERLPCQECGNPKSEGHHHKGYSEEHALDVIWLCKKHHAEAETKLKLTNTESCTTRTLSALNNVQGDSVREQTPTTPGSEVEMPS